MEGSPRELHILSWTLDSWSGVVHGDDPANHARCLCADKCYA